MQLRVKLIEILKQLKGLERKVKELLDEELKKTA